MRGSSFGYSVAVRLPMLALVGLYWFAATRQADQVAVLFEDSAQTWRGAILVTATALGSLWIAIATPRSHWSHAVVDFVGLVAAMVAIIYGLREAAPAYIAVLIAVACGAIGAGWALLRAPATGWRWEIASVAALIVIWFVLRGFIAQSPIEFPRSMGALALTAAFLVTTALFLTYALRHPWFGIPLLVVVTVIFASDERSHAIRQDPVDPALEMPRQYASLQEAFAVWLGSRNDRASYDVYPVFLVVSEGGGGFAAAHASAALAGLQRLCPNFAQHVFALVGVSGGAVGNTLFQQGLKGDINPESAPGCGNSLDASVLSAAVKEDHLSPTIAALLYQDLPNRLLFGALGDTDRADVLAASLAGGDGLVAAPANIPYWDHYWAASKPDQQFVLGERPALVQVATNAVTGKRYVFAPFSFTFSPGRIEESLGDLSWEATSDAGSDGADQSVGGDDLSRKHYGDVPVFDVAVASATFPYLTPGQTLAGKDGRNVLLVDGGYVDNSGAETARDIAEELSLANPFADGADIVSMARPASSLGVDCGMAEAEDRPVRTTGDESASLEKGPCAVPFSIHVLIIRADAARRDEIKPSELLDPLHAAFSERDWRSVESRYTLLGQLCGRQTCFPQVERAADWQLYENVIRTDQLALPLGWYLPGRNLDEMLTNALPDRSTWDAQSVVSEAEQAELGLDSRWGTASSNGYSLGKIAEVLSPPQPESAE